MSVQVTDDQRHAIEAAILASLLLIYGGRKRETLDRLGRFDHPATPTAAAQKHLAAFARKRAQLVQDGINQRLAAAQLPDTATDDERMFAQARAHQEIREYNRDRLIPFLTKTALVLALVDTYRELPGVSDPQVRLADEVQWTWSRNTDAPPDECEEAAAASPTSLDDLLSITGSEPPVHTNCQCDLIPNA